jgi:hypothetical protein
VLIDSPRPPMPPVINAIRLAILFPPSESDFG